MLYEKIIKILNEKQHTVVSGKSKDRLSPITDEKKSLERIFNNGKDNLIDFTYNCDGELLKITITVREKGLYNFKHYYYVINF